MTNVANETTKEYDNSLSADGIGLFLKTSKAGNAYLFGTCKKDLKVILAFPKQNDWGNSFSLIVKNGVLNEKGYVDSIDGEDGLNLYINEIKGQEGTFIDKTKQYEGILVNSDNEKAPKLRLKKIQ